MNSETKRHIRRLLWDFKKIEHCLKKYEDILLMSHTSFSMVTFEKSSDKIGLNQIAFHKYFLATVEEVLKDSTSDVRDLFLSKYKNGYPGKKNEVVAYETYLSLSSIKRRDSEFLEEVARQLGWLEV